MELGQAIEFAVVSSWDELVKPGERGSIHVEYKNIADLPLSSVEVWMIKNRGYGTLVCEYSVSPAGSPASSSQAFGMHFANLHSSKTLARSLDFIIRNQGQFSRSIGGSIHGLVQIDCPGESQRRDAAAWSGAIRAGSAAIAGSGA
jgi:hypothetical protein